MTTLLLTAILLQASDGLQFNKSVYFDRDIIEQRSRYDGDDYYFDQAVENFVIDVAIGTANDKGKPALFGDYMPKPVKDAVLLLYEDCERCKRRGMKDLEAIGRPAVRWLWWARRSVHSQVQANSMVVIRKILECKACQGTGYCLQFVPREGAPEQCDTCRWYRLSHEYQENLPCKWCQTWGMMGKIE